MECPHCGKSIHFEPWSQNAFAYPSPVDGATGYAVACGFCPACDKFIAIFQEGKYAPEGGALESLEDIVREVVIWPRDVAPRALPEDVPTQYAEVYREAAAVRPISPKASAALSRRLLQTVLADRYGLKHASLAQAIDAFVALPDVPSHLKDAVDAVRNVGNFAAHPLKDTSTGEVVSVEAGEADWLLEVLDALLDTAFVQPAKLEARRQQLNAKLRSVGKPPMKTG